MRRLPTPLALLVLTVPWACFAESDEVTGDAGDTTSSSSSSGATGEAGSASDVGSDGEASSSTASSGSEAGSAGTSGLDDTTGGESSDGASTGDAATWCEDQPPDVVVCLDFDGEVPLLGLQAFEAHGTVDVSEDHAVSAPRSMLAAVTEDPAENSVATVQTAAIDAAPTPFAGAVATQVWVDPQCFAGDANDHLLLGLMFHDDTESFLNLTVWFRPTETILYASTEPFGSPSVAHPMAVDFPLGEWVNVELVYAADDTTASLTVGRSTEQLVLSNVNDAVLAEIAQLAPYLTVGTNMYAGSPTCSIYFDDVTVTV